MIHTDQGYLQYDASTGLYNYHYYLTDHLGNVRAVLKRAGSSTIIEQQVDYYPFGMHKPLASTGINRYLYNRKELQGELGYYEYGARQYDPSIGRWNVVDPMAENHYGFSSYASPGLQLGVFVLHQGNLACFDKVVNGSEQAFLFLFGECCNILKPFEHSGVFKQVCLFVFPNR